LEVIAHVADEASDLRHLLSHGSTVQSDSTQQASEQGLLTPRDDSPETPLPEPAGMALSTLAVTARKIVTALRDVREREGRLEREVKEGRQKFQQLER
jgi:hypothetical protein